MPDIVVHSQMGKNVYRRLKMNLNVRAFRFGLLGPDPFLFSLPHFYKYSSVMHREKTGDFLLEMARSSRSNEEFSYLCGFLCHYALDCETHPFIVSLSRKLYGDTVKGSAMHIAIEHRLDLLEGKRIYIPPMPSDRVIRFFSDCIKRVYGWKNSEMIFRMGRRHMPAFYLFVRDRYGIMNKMCGWTKSAAAMISNKSSMCDDLDLSGFPPLVKKAEDSAVEYIKCANDFVQRRINESEFRKVVGSRSYI